MQSFSSPTTRESRLGYFAALYRRVTSAVRDGISNGSFQNGPLMERLDVVFASRYLDAWLRIRGGTQAAAGCLHFMAATMLTFSFCSNCCPRDEHAHINLDLGIAAARVGPGDQLPNSKPDFDQINAILAAQIGAVASEIAAVSPLIGDLEKMRPHRNLDCKLRPRCCT